MLLKEFKIIFMQEIVVQGKHVIAIIICYVLIFFISFNWNTLLFTKYDNIRMVSWFLPKSLPTIEETVNPILEWELRALAKAKTDIQCCVSVPSFDIGLKFCAEHCKFCVEHIFTMYKDFLYLTWNFEPCNMFVTWFTQWFSCYI